MVVKCPICNVKVPFSLPMHMMMAHGPHANGANAAEEELHHAQENLQPPSMNAMRSGQVDKRKRPRRPHRRRK